MLQHPRVGSAIRKINFYKSISLPLWDVHQGRIQSLERGVRFVEKEKVEDQKKELSERSSNITMKLKYIIIIPIYSFTDNCLINTACMRLLY